MTSKSNIEWTEQTWNPATGCTKISPGCKNCYAETLTPRLKAMGAPAYDNGFNLSLMPARLAQPLSRKKPTMYFVNSMSDLFHEGISDEYLGEIFDVIKRTPHHTYQILTKRAERLPIYLNIREEIGWPKPVHNSMNVLTNWIGPIAQWMSWNCLQVQQYS